MNNDQTEDHIPAGSMPFQRAIKGEHENLFTEKLGRPTPLYLEELSIFLTSGKNGELKALYHYGFQYCP